MQTIEFIMKNADIALAVVSLGILFVLYRKELTSQFAALTALVSVELFRSVVCTALLFYRKPLGVSLPTAYNTYFGVYWISQILIAICQICVLYGAFSYAMRPLEGLHEVGKLIFRWIAAVSAMVTLAIVFTPHGKVPMDAPIGAVAKDVMQQINQGIGILTLCLLLFVCFSTRPLGLTFRSRAFGAILGLGVLATSTLVQTAWSGISPSYSLYSPIAVFGVISDLCAVLVWATYFVLPEPERRLILLPTASPYFFWNHLSEALGDEPGHVVVGGLTPAMFSEAEMAMFSAPDSDLPNAPLVTDFDAPALQTPHFANAS